MCACVYMHTYTYTYTCINTNAHKHTDANVVNQPCIPTSLQVCGCGGHFVQFNLFIKGFKGKAKKVQSSNKSLGLLTIYGMRVCVCVCVCVCVRACLGVCTVYASLSLSLSLSLFVYVCMRVLVGSPLHTPALTGVESGVFLLNHSRYPGGRSSNSALFLSPHSTGKCLPRIFVFAVCHVHAHIHTHTHIYTHTYTHTHIHIHPYSRYNT